MSRRQQTVYVVDDDKSIRTGLRRLLRSVGMEVEVFEDPRAFLAADLRGFPACVVLDLMMPGVGGLEVQEALEERGLRLPIVFLTGRGTVPDTVQAIKRGAVDFLEKPVEDEVLLAAIEAGFRRHFELLADAEEREEAERCYASLTAREQDVFALVVKGLTNREVAESLGISEKTVKLHRGRVMSKMDADSLAELVRVAERNDLA